jgi:Protein of unknown function (DUF4012)
VSESTPATEAELDAEWRSREDLRAQRRNSKRIVLALVLAAGLGGLFAGCHPTGTPVIDELYSGLFAAGVTLIASQASRQSLLIFGAGCVAMSRDWLLLPALVAFGVALYQVAQPNSRRRMGAIVGALGSQVILRWPPIGFHGATAVAAVVVLAYPGFSAYGRLSKSGRRRTRRALGVAAVVVVIPVVLLGLAVELTHTRLSEGQKASIAALHELRSGTPGSAAQALAGASDKFATASSTLGSWWTEPLRLFPVVAQQRQALADGASMGQRLAKVASQQAPGFDLQALSVTDGQIDVSKVTALLGPAKILNTALAGAQATMAGLRSQWLVSPLQSRLISLSEQLNEARDSANAAVKTIPVLPAMLGDEGTRHYLAVFETPAEMRGLGGVITGYAELTAVDGKISLVNSGPVGTLDSALPSGGGKLTGPASFLARYGQFHPQKYFQDETYPPDLPTTAQVLSELYPQTGGSQLDGVIVIDPFGLAQLLKLTGPVKVPGLPVALDSTNTPSELMEDQYILYGSVTSGPTRHDYGAAALQIVFNRLTSIALPSPSKVAHSINDALQGGHIAMWSSHADEESVLNLLHASETFPSRDGGDLLAVTLQNSGNNDIDVFLHQTITDHVVFNPSTGAVRAQLSIALQNGAPSSGLPAVVIDNLGSQPAPPGSNDVWMSIYTPLTLRNATLNGSPLSLGVGTELGVNVYSGFVDIPSGTTGSADLALTGTIAPNAKYRLHLRVQPSANPVSTTVTVSTSQGAPPASTWTANSNVSQYHSFKP